MSVLMINSTVCHQGLRRFTVAFVFVFENIVFLMVLPLLWMMSHPKLKNAIYRSPCYKYPASHPKAAGIYSSSPVTPSQGKENCKRWTESSKKNISRAKSTSLLLLIG